ncbi:ALG3 [Lepeophtheirus salmonis]|uniref:dolichyl-P-Man:Man5GlcNAc2-PP-dolichol alpha-1,3-mannosyltransferase n=1 Tax=Lepeophtheirus salmonis TaxID=72036 RepID=A0A7R8CJV4_LEPSM|nr:ALG3 [Lepeophtheirus salmonis]CAF2809629.1 ALG3 [Lepeophtheirus salmonis]
MPRVNKKTSWSLKSLFSLLQNLVYNPDYCVYVAVALLPLELVLNVFIVERVPYTEIDWIAYMQESEGFLSGERNYTSLTMGGKSIKTAQKVPPYILCLMSLTSYRIHSIFVLRLFNDPLAMLLLYISINLFVSEQWSLGSLFFSLAVSIKMNILLFAPALLVAYIAILGPHGAFSQLLICATVQIAIAFPFITTFPVEYIRGSFDLGRIFMHKWTVNYRFLSEELFVSKSFHMGLLVLHLLFIALFTPYWWRLLSTYSDLSHNLRGIKDQLFLLPLFTCNFIGLIFARSLHYQFYVWYYHQLHYLCWCTNYPVKVKLLILGLIELCWNTYPSTDWSSFCLHSVHLVLLVGVFNYTKKACESAKNIRLYALSSLNEDILKRVKFEEFKPQSDDSYTLLKVALLKNLQPQNKEKVGRLVSLLYSEAKRLSINETLCRMEYLLPHNYNPRVDLIRYAILQATPASLRNELLTKFDIPLHEFIKLAKFIEMDNITPLGFHGGLSMIPRDCYFHKVFGDDARKCETPDKCPPLTIYFKEESE